MIKNKILNISIILIVFFSSVYGQDSSASKLVNPEVLKLVYKYAVTSADSTQFGKLFFYIFPNQFVEFNNIYGYFDSVGKMPLYDVSDQHLNLLFKQYKQVPDSIFYDKVIRIAIEAKWDVDAINFFQNHLYTLIHRNPLVVITILNNYTESQIRNFCTFIIAGYNPSDSDIRSKYNSLYNEFIKADIHMAKYLEDAYNELIKM